MENKAKKNKRMENKRMENKASVKNHREKSQRKITEKKTLAVITARGGSKRIPRKNIKEFCGKPIIYYSIEAALESGIFSEVMVSTEDEEIARIARQAGANVPFMRSEETSGDFATTAQVLMEVLAEYEKRGQEFDSFACLYPTAPFITPQKLRDGMNLLQTKNASMIMPVIPFSFPPRRANVLSEEGQLIYKWEKYRNSRSQDLETMYHDCGQFYFYKTAEFVRVNGEITKGIYPLVLSELEVQDIDNEVDWQLAELKYQLLKNERN